MNKKVDILYMDNNFNERLKNIFHYYTADPEEMEKELHILAKELLDKGEVKQAWQVLLALN